jgi:amino acid transporter
MGDKYGFRFWKDPGVFVGTNFREVVNGIFDAVLWGTFAYVSESLSDPQVVLTPRSIVGPDYISLVAGEVKNPRRVLPKAFNSTIYRVLFFYITGALCVGIVAGSDDPALLGAISAGAPGAARSPYVICKLTLFCP